MTTIKMHDDEISVDVDLVRKMLNLQFPHWATLPLKRIASAGTDNAIFRLGGNLCIRMPRIDGAEKNIQKEHAWLPTLAESLPLPISVPIAQGLPSDVYPWHWSICRWLDGDNAFDVPIADLDHCAKTLAHFLTCLHHVDASKGPASRRASALVTQDVEVEESLAALSTSLDVNLLARIWHKCKQAPTWNSSPVWTHGDLLPTNLLVTAGKLSAIIDFDLMGVGDPACDMIVAWSVLSKDTRKVFRSLVGVDDATWARGIGWALSIALIIIPYYQTTNPTLVSIAHHMINEILSDCRG